MINASDSVISANTITSGPITSSPMQTREAFQITIRALKDRAGEAQIQPSPWREGKLLGCLAELEEYLRQCEKDSFEGREELLLEMSIFYIKLKNVIKPKEGKQP